MAGGGCARGVVVLLLVLAVASARAAAVQQPRGWRDRMHTLLNPGYGGAKHVVLVSAQCLQDASAGDAFETMPHLRTLKKHGAWSMDARATPQSFPAPGWNNIVMGAGPDETGMGQGEWASVRDDTHASVYPSAVQTAKAAGLRTAAYLTDARMVRFLPPHAVDHMLVVGGTEHTQLWQTAGEDLAGFRPHLSFVFLGEHVDLPALDGIVGGLMTMLTRAHMFNDTLLLLSADAGGVRSPGHVHAASFAGKVPWVASGPMVAAQRVPFVRDIDVAPTALYALGVVQPLEWVGKAMASIFTRTGTRDARAPTGWPVRVVPPAPDSRDAHAHMVPIVVE